MLPEELMQFRKLIRDQVNKGKSRYEPLLNSKDDLEGVQLGSCEVRLCSAVQTWEVKVVFSQLNSTTREPFTLTPQKVGRRSGTKWCFEERGKGYLYSLPNLAQAVLDQLGSFENASV